MSLYTEAMHELQKAKCMTCDGWGELDDAELGDKSHGRWNCHACGGSGFVQKEGATRDESSGADLQLRNANLK